MEHLFCRRRPRRYNEFAMGNDSLAKKRLEGPNFDTWHILELAAIHFPDTIAVIDRGTEAILTYSELHEEATALASWMYEKGLRRGDRIGVHCRNSSAVMKIHFAAAALHVTVVNLNVNLAAAELEYILVNSKCQLCFVDTGVSAALLDARKRILKEGKAANNLDVVWVHVDKSVKQPLEEEEFGYEFSRCVSYEGRAVSLPDTQGSLDDAFHMYYTSGTTGKPKPVELSHRIVVYHAVGTIKGKRRKVLF